MGISVVKWQNMSKAVAASNGNVKIEEKIKLAEFVLYALAEINLK